MSLQYTDGINLMGQSNMSALLQGLIANAIAPEVFVAGAAVGGARLANDTWLSLAEPWTRAAYYTSLIARHNGAKYQRLVSVFFQGESDTESDPLSLAHQAKVAAYHAFLAADLVATGGVLYEVILLPWNTSVGGGTGYTNVRAGLQAYVAASPSTRVAIDTASWGRSGDNVHLTPAQVATNAPTIIAAINAFLTRAAATEGGTSGGGGGGGGGATNLSCSTSTTTATIASDTGTDATIPAATGSAAGVMTAAQATKLAGIADGATANATDAQLRDRSSHTGTQAISTVTGLQTALDGKAASAHTHALSDLTVSGATSGQVPTWNGTAWAPATPSGGGGGGSGTVTTVSVVTANGVSATVANATTTPAITITLAAITPTSVNGLTITTTTGTLTLTNGKTLSVSNTLTIAGTDGSTLNIGTGGALNTAAFAAKSLGGNAAADSGKVAQFDSTGGLTATTEIQINNASTASHCTIADDGNIALHLAGETNPRTLGFPDDILEGQELLAATRPWVAAGYQPLDADLTALAALTGTDTLYYRSAANTWTAVTIGSGITFAGGNLSASGGGSSPTTTRGDLIRRGASADERLALGAMHRSVMSDGTDPVWGVTSEWFAGVVHGMYYVGSSATPSTFNTSGAPSAQGTTARVAGTSTVPTHATSTSVATTGSLAGVNSSAVVHTSRAFEAVIYGGIDSLATTRFFAGFFGNVNTMGANDSPSGTTCIAVRYSSAAGDTNWQLVTSNGATATVQATSIAATTGIHKFTIRSSGSSSMKFWIDDVYAGEVTTTLPAAYIAMGVIGATLANVAIVVRHIQSYCIEPL